MAKNQVTDLIDDLTSKFFNNYQEGDQRDQVENYDHYFLGSIIISRARGRWFIVDGQQRLTTLTLINDKPYSEKCGTYGGQNLLAKSLHESAYEHNPGFRQFCERSELPFQAHSEFNKVDIDKRQRLYQLISEQIWNPECLFEYMS